MNSFFPTTFETTTMFFLTSRHSKRGAVPKKHLFDYWYVWNTTDPGLLALLYCWYMNDWYRQTCFKLLKSRRWRVHNHQKIINWNQVLSYSFIIFNDIRQRECDLLITEYKLKTRNALSYLIATCCNNKHMTITKRTKHECTTTTQVINYTSTQAHKHTSN